jgi:DNA invertase Pin-like site-specific DNA recombinase
MATSYAARKGLNLDTSLTFHDLGVSAFKGINAETGRLADFLEAVRAGLVPQGSFLLVEALDRLSRLTPRKALRVLEDIVDSGVTVVTLNDEKVYSTGSLDKEPFDLMVAIMLFMRANEESATKARRLAAAWEGKRLLARTNPLTACVPAWIRLDKTTAPGKLVLIPERAEVVKRIFAESLSGYGSAAIAQGLIKDGVPCFGKATHWHRTYVTKILKNPATHGVFTPHQNHHSGSKVVRVPLAPIVGYYPQVITQGTFEECHRLGDTAHTVKARKGQLVNLFGGLAVCPLCGSTMTRVNKGSVSKAGRPKLVCVKAKAGAGCTYHGVDLESVEGGLRANLGGFIGNAPSGVAGLDHELEQVEVSIEVVQDQVSNITEALSGGPSVSLVKKLRDLEITLAELEVSRADLVDRIGSGSSPVLAQRLRDLEVIFSEEPLDRPRANAALRSVLSSVVVDYVSGQLCFHWKHGGESSVTYAWPFHIVVSPLQVAPR